VDSSRASLYLLSDFLSYIGPQWSPPERLFYLLSDFFILYMISVDSSQSAPVVGLYVSLKLEFLYDRINLLFDLHYQIRDTRPSDKYQHESII
jgi:hypothetical protein